MTDSEITHFVRFTDLQGPQFTVPIVGAASPGHAARLATRHLPVTGHGIEVWDAGERHVYEYQLEAAD